MNARKATQHIHAAPTLTKLDQVRVAPTVPDLRAVREARAVETARREGRYCVVTGRK